MSRGGAQRTRRISGRRIGSVASLIGIGMLGLSAITATGAMAAPVTTSKSGEIKGGNDGYDAGTFTVTRSLDGGTETIKATMNVTTAGGGKSATLCIKGTPFASAANFSDSSLCPEQQAGPAASFTLTHDIGSAYFGQTVHIQLRVRAADPDTGEFHNAYGGFHAFEPDPRTDQFGEIALPPLEEPTTTTTEAATTTTRGVVGTTTPIPSTTAKATTTTKKPTEVLGEQLPRTGSNSATPFALAGAVLLLMGVVFVSAGERKGAHRITK